MTYLFIYFIYIVPDGVINSTRLLTRLNGRSMMPFTSNRKVFINNELVLGLGLTD